MIKLKYGTESERNALATEYLGIFLDKGRMLREWTPLRSDLVGAVASLDALLPTSLDELLKKPYSELVDIYEDYVANEANITDDLTKRAKRLFSYEAYEYQSVKGPKQSSRIARFFMKHANDMQLYTCHYCDMAYINTYPTGPRKKNNHFDLDHVLDKGKCPILALSFFNFVPVCPVCNGRIKSTKQVATTTAERKKLSPTNPNYDFEGNVTIWVDHPAGKCSTFGFEKRMDEYELKFDCHKDLDYQKEIDFFRLVPRYNFHKCEALRLMDLKERYTEARIVEMARLIMGDDSTKGKDLGADSIINQIKKDIFADDFMNEHHRVFGKLHKDILS